MKPLNVETVVPQPRGDRGERQAMAELLHLAAVGRNTAAIAHDIRNELQAVAAALWLVDKQSDAHFAELTRDALAAVERAAALSRQIVARGAWDTG